MEEHEHDHEWRVLAETMFKGKLSEYVVCDCGQAKYRIKEEK